MTGLPAPPAILAPLPLRGLPVPALSLTALFRLGGLLRRRSPRVGAIHPQTPRQLGNLQLQPPQLTLGVKLRAQPSQTRP